MGVFSIIQKHKMHHSNIYSGAPMPFMQRITWSGVAMHAGVLPGYPASHGCIRMPMAFAVKMWNWTRMGARVVITPGEMTPASFSHPLLVDAEGRAAAASPPRSRRLDAPLGRRNPTRAPTPTPRGQADRHFRGEPRTAIDRRSCPPLREDPHRGRQRRDAGQRRRHDVRCRRRIRRGMPVAAERDTARRRVTSDEAKPETAKPETESAKAWTPQHPTRSRQTPSRLNRDRRDQAGGATPPTAQRRRPKHRKAGRDGRAQD